MAKLNRERSVIEKRHKKQARKDARKAAAEAAPDGPVDTIATEEYRHAVQAGEPVAPHS